MPLCSLQIPHDLTWGSKLGRRSGKQANNSLSPSTARFPCMGPDAQFFRVDLATVTRVSEVTLRRRRHDSTSKGAAEC
jgi:hypothetical protein